MGIVNDYTVRTRGIGLPDYAQAKPVSGVPVGPIYTSTDTAELAARLGAIDIFDRRGNVIWFDDFESGITKWQFVGTGVGEGAEWNSARARFGGFSCKLTTGDVIDNNQLMIHSEPYPVIGTMGIEFSFSDGEDGTIVWQLILYDGTDLHSMHIRYNIATGRFQYFRLPLGWQDIEPVRVMDYGQSLFHHIKCVGNFNTDEYLRLIYDDVTFDLSGIPLDVQAVGIQPRLDASLIVTTTINANVELYVDDVILTQNEPANLVE